MNIQLLALDLDGTVLTVTKDLSARNIEAIRRAAFLGIRIIPTSGRTFGNMPDEILSLPGVTHAITSNGAAIVDMKSGKSVYRHCISADTAAAILELLKRFPVQPSAYIDGQMYDYEQIDLESLKAVHGIGSLARRIRVPDLGAYIREKGAGVEKLFVLYLDRSCAGSVREALADIPGILFTSSGVNNMEINAMGATKGNALSWLCSRLGIPKEAVMAIGDGHNDLSMLRFAGYPIAMGNAVEELKAQAADVTLSCEESGVAHAIERYLDSIGCSSDVKIDIKTGL